MRFPVSSYLNEPLRSSVRFVIVGTLGTLLQYLFYDFFLWLFSPATGDISHFMANVAYTVAFLLETSLNYIATSYYTFSTRPTIKNLLGFIGSRVVNYLVQIGLLNVSLLLLVRWENQLDPERWAGVIAILVAGIVNYFFLRVIYRKKKEIQTQQQKCENK